MGTCKLRAGDRRESVIGYRSTGAQAFSGGNGLSNYPAGPPGQPTPPYPSPGNGDRGQEPGPGCGGHEDASEAGVDGHTPRTFPFASSRLQIQLQPSLPPRCPFHPPAGAPHWDPAPGAHPEGQGMGIPPAGASTCSPRQHRPEKLERVPTMCL